MDIATNKAGYVTTIQMPLEMRQEIKNRGMTIQGALKAGMLAMDELKKANQEIAELKLNMDRYRRGYIRLTNELSMRGEMAKKEAPHAAQ